MREREREREREGEREREEMKAREREIKARDKKNTCKGYHGYTKSKIDQKKKQVK